MFKTLRAGGRVLGLSRTPLRVHAHALHDPSMNIQKVRFYEPFRPRRFLASFIAVGIGYTIFQNVALAPLDKVAEDLEDEEEEEEEDHSIFLPFPLTIKEVKPQPYKGTDPEWLEFVKFSKSQELNRNVRSELAYLVQKVCERTIARQLRAGDNKAMKVNRYWLDVDYPHSPPPEFERSGIEISDSGVRWTRMPVDSMTVFRLKYILWPSAMTQSLWSFWKVLLTQNSKRVYEMFGIQNQPDQQQKFEQLLARAAKTGTANSESTAKEDQPTNTRKLEEPHTPQSPTAPGSGNAVTKASDEKSKPIVKAPNKAGFERVGLGNLEPHLMEYKMHMLRALVAFRAKFMQTWRPVPNYPPRGSLIVSGFVELDTPRAWIVVDVRAAWDPKTRTFDQRSMFLKIRRFQQKSQPPKG